MTLKIKLEIWILFGVLALCYPCGYNPYSIDLSTIQYTTNNVAMRLAFNISASLSDANAETPDIKVPAVLFESLDSRVMRFKLTDGQNPRWEVPIYNPDSRKYYTPFPINDTGLTYSNKPFGFSIADPTDKAVFLSTLKTKNTTLNFTDKLIEFGLWFPAKKIFGLGERVTPDFELCDKASECIYTIYTKDDISPLDTGKFPGGKNIYGHQPFYMLQLLNEKFAGAFFLNSNPQDAIIVKSNVGINVYHKTIGGIIDFYVFYPDSPENVIKNYHKFIGRPYLPPLWVLGFHQCRWGWETLAKVEEVVKKFDQADIPLDVVWADIDYMENFKDFSIDPVRYKGLSKFVDKLHSKAMHWVPIIDAGISYEENDPYFKKGKEDNTFIKSAVTKNILIGSAWPKYIAYVDWLNVNASSLWHMGLNDLYKKANFDGIWLDMNEASNFCEGECNTTQEASGAIGAVDPHDPNEFNKLPYLPGNVSLTLKSIAPTGYHPSTDEYKDKFHKEYNLHSLWAFHQSIVTQKYFTEKLKKRPFVLTRANFAGSGMFTSKWLGDNYSRWEYLRYSIVGVYNSQLYSIPITGADICGFVENTTEELCARWMQLGAFYPFSRNHNENSTIPQEPYQWPRVASAGRNAIRQKYSILRYYYTKLFEISLNGGSLIKPLFFERPDDEKAYSKRLETFMIGPAIMVAPVVYASKTTVEPYFTNENWFDLTSGKQLMKYDETKKEGKTISLAADFDFVNVLLRGGNIVPFQNAIKANIRRMKTLEVLPMKIIVAPSHEGTAKGNIIIDNEDAINPIPKSDYTEITITFSMKTKTLTVKSSKDNAKRNNFERFSELSIYGAESIAKATVVCIRSKSSDFTVTGSYEATNKVLSFYRQTNIYWRDITEIQIGRNCTE